MTLKPSELLELAKKLYPDKRWMAGHSRPHYEGPGTYDFDEVYFDPSLTGEDWQKAQALDCIVAAFKLENFASLIKDIHGDGISWYTRFYDDDGVIQFSAKPELYDDPLSAAAQALLAVGE